jgi:hypothetical protein
MYIYLLHTFFLYPLRESGVLDHQPSPFVLIGMILLAIAISVFLSQPFIKKAFHWVIEPDFPWLFRKQALAQIPPPSAPDVPVPPGTVLLNDEEHRTPTVAAGPGRGEAQAMTVPRDIASAAAGADTATATPAEKAARDGSP